MAPAAVPVSTTCDRPEIDRQLRGMILDLTQTGGLSIRQATERTARHAAECATRKGWRSDLVDFVAIRAVDLGAQLARAAA